MNKISLIVLILAYLWLAKTQNCIANCDACTNSTACTDCADTFFLDQQKACRKCPEGCAVCEPTQQGIVCSDCFDDFQLGNGRCFKCVASCGSGCTLNPENCADCDLGFQLVDGPNSEKRCIPLENCEPQNCGACANGVTDKCQTCMPGYFQFMGVCIRCKFPCVEGNFPIDTFFSTSVNGTMETLMNQVQGNLTNNGSNVDIQAMVDRDTPSKYHKDIMVLVVHFNNYLINTHGVSQDDIVTELVNNIDTYTNFDFNDIFQIGAAMFANLTGTEIHEEQLIHEMNKMINQDVVCTKCALKFGINPQDKCQSCVEGCLTCPSLTCDNCEPGLSLGTNVCQPCLGNCKTCADGDTSSCLSCVAPYSLSGDICILCEAPCKTCQPGDLSFCLTCIKPFSIEANANGTCFRCKQDLCKKCLPENNQVCLECGAGNTLVEGKCQSCAKNCKECSTQQCLVCEAGYFMNQEEKCEPCRPGCAECQDQEQCLACIEGFFLNKESQCKRCKQGCQKCNSQQQCSQFEPGHAQFNGQVVQCKKGCDQCNPESPQQCLVCSPRFYLDTNVCKRCGENCETCNSANDCTQCIPNTHNAGDGNCRRCQGACRTCDSGNLTQCLSCRRGFILNGTKCEKLCEKFCVDCDPQNPTVCLKASQGHTIKEDGKVVKCLGSCSGSCDPRDISICTSCIDGFQLIQNKCVRCPKGCASCRNGSCEQCHKGFEIFEDTDKMVCKKSCKSPCIECDGDKCEACAAGFNLVDNKCQIDLSCGSACEFCPPGSYISAEDANGKTCTLCSANCASCDNSQCFTCMDGYYENAGSCSPCNENCLICNDLESCEVCANGFFHPIIAEDDSGSKQYSDLCEQCSSQCMTCVDNADQCDSCPQNRKEKGFTCFTRLVVKFLLEFDIDFEQFKQNGVSQDIIDKMTEILGKETTQIILDAISEGSSVVDGSTQISSEQEGATLATLLVQGDYGFTLLSSSVGVYFDDQEVQNTQEQIPEDDNPGQQEKVNVGLIVGLVVGGVVLAVIIGVIVYKVKFAKKAQNVAVSDNISFDDFRKQSNDQVGVTNYGANEKIIYN